MSELLKKLRFDMIDSMKSGDKSRKDILSQLISRATLIAKNDKNREVTDRDVIQAVEKTIKDAKDTREFAIKGNRDITSYDFEIVSKYLPAQFTREEIQSLVNLLLKTAPEGKAARGYVMKNMNINYKGSFDPQIVNQILSELGI